MATEDTIDLWPLFEWAADNVGEWATTPIPGGDTDTGDYHVTVAESYGFDAETETVDDELILKVKATALSSLRIWRMTVGDFIQSADYDGTDFATADAATGWRIDGDGIEALALRARGELEATDLVPYAQADILGADGTFESAPAWMTQSSTVARTGTYSGRVASPAGESFSVSNLDKANVNADADAWWRISGYVRAGTTGVRVYFGAKEGASGYLFQFAKTLRDTTNWHAFDVFVKITAGATLRLSAAVVSNDGATANQYAYFDDLQAQRLGTMRDDWIADGDLFTVGADAVAHPVAKSAAHVYRDSNNTVANTTWHSVPLTAEVRDDESLHTTGTGDKQKVLIPTTGWWLLNGFVGWDTNTTGQRVVSIRKNGVAGAGTNLGQVRAAAIADLQQNVTAIAYLSAGDYVTLDVWQNSGGIRTYDTAGTWAPSLRIAQLS